MSEAKHTSGPWVAIPSRTRWHGSEPLFVDGLWSILPESNIERIPICVVDHADDHYAPARQRAEYDARLIASAPGLLDALNEIHKWLVCAAITTAEDMAQSFDHMEQVASIAIAKAEGVSR